jgi:myo-inositol-1(or 4)-monophosphatase
MDDLAVAREAAGAGAAVVRRWYRRIERADFKGATNPVTEADRQAEAAIVEVIGAHRSGDEIVAEEGSAITTGSGRRWLIDPLDGTVNYLHGFPQCAVSVALHVDEMPSVGVILDVFRNEEFSARLGKGAKLNGRPISVSSTADLGEALVATGFAYDRQQKARSYTDLVADVLSKVQGIRRLGAAAIDLAWVACGRLDGHWEFGLAPWDIAAGLLLVAEAGGKVTDSYGAPARPQDIIATNGLIHEPLLAIVAEARPPHFER